MVSRRTLRLWEAEKGRGDCLPDLPVSHEAFAFSLSAPYLVTMETTEDAMAYRSQWKKFVLLYSHRNPDLAQRLLKVRCLEFGHTGVRVGELRSEGISVDDMRQVGRWLWDWFGHPTQFWVGAVVQRG